jgi:geranylgeranyl diphosphate synthase type II
MEAGAVARRLAEDAARVESFLAGFVRGEYLLHGTPRGRLAAKENSRMAGGKRLRPSLCLAFTRFAGGDDAAALPFAAAIECIHSYSLIHDDLPAMDDDDMRRGKPSCHKRFDEASAILAGDGLLTDAFGLMASCAASLPAARVLEAVAVTARAAGSPGMVGGQFLDMGYTGMRGLDLDRLRTMQAMKTGALITASCLSGAILAGADEAKRACAASYGRALGAAFQIADDILDETGDEALLGKPVGSDAAMGKVTCPSLLGLEQSRRLAAQERDAALEALAPHADKAESAFLRGLAAYVVDRVS